MPITPFPSQGQYPWYYQLEQWGADTQSAAESAELNADGLRADVATALSDSTAASAAAIAAAGLVGAPAGDAVLAAISEGGAARGEIDDAISEPSGNVTMRSPVDPLADSKRIHLRSFQKQEPENEYNGGETVWLDVSPTAKSMLTWRLPVNKTTKEIIKNGPYSEADWQRVVWAGAHWFAQDQPDDNNPTEIHAHWSVETPDADLALRTRFEIMFGSSKSSSAKVGADLTHIMTCYADFTVRVAKLNSSAPTARLRIAGVPDDSSGANGYDKALEWSAGVDGTNETKKRWQWVMTRQHEAGNDIGSNFALRRYSDTGEYLTPAMTVYRRYGNVGFGTAENDLRAGRVTAVWGSDRPNDAGFLAVSESGTASSSPAFFASMNSSSGRAFASQAASDSVQRFTVGVDGKQEWGNGLVSRDTNLYRRKADRLATDSDLEVTGNKGIVLTDGSGGKWLVKINSSGVLYANSVSD